MEIIEQTQGAQSQFKANIKDKIGRQIDLLDDSINKEERSRLCNDPDVFYMKNCKKAKIFDKKLKFFLKKNTLFFRVFFLRKKPVFFLKEKKRFFKRKNDFFFKISLFFIGFSEADREENARFRAFRAKIRSRRHSG